MSTKKAGKAQAAKKSAPTTAELIEQAVGLGMAQEEAEAMSDDDLAAFLTEQGAMPEAESDGYEHPSKEKRVKLTIHEQEGTVGKQDVSVSVNGYAYQVKRGVEVEVPESVVNVLEDAVMTVFEPGEKAGTFVERNVRRFSFQVSR